MKIPPVEAELFHADFREKRTDMMKLTVTFLNFVNVPKTGTAEHRASGWLRNSPPCTTHPHNRLVCCHDIDRVINNEDIEP
jgi:hypothetical protein